MTDTGGDIRHSGEAQEADRQVPERGHHLSSRTLPHLRTIFVESDVANIVQAVFDRPVPTDEIEHAAGRGLLRSQAGDALDNLVVMRCTIQVADVSLYLENLPAMREVYILIQVDADPDPTYFQPAVALIDRFGLRGEKSGARDLRCAFAEWVGCL